MNLNQAKIAVIGLGYVGLPLAVEFGKKRLSSGLTSTRRVSQSYSQVRTRPLKSVQKS